MIASRSCVKGIPPLAPRSEVRCHATALQRRMDRSRMRSLAAQLKDTRKFTSVILESGRPSGYVETALQYWACMHMPTTYSKAAIHGNLAVEKIVV